MKIKMRGKFTIASLCNGDGEYEISKTTRDGKTTTLHVGLDHRIVRAATDPVMYVLTEWRDCIAWEIMAERRTLRAQKITGES